MGCLPWLVTLVAAVGNFLEVLGAKNMEVKDIVTIYENEPRVGTWILAKGLTSGHKSICQLIRRHWKDFAEIDCSLILQRHKLCSTGGRPAVEYMLNINQIFFLISLLKNNTKTIQIKKHLIKMSTILKALELLESFDSEEAIDRYVYAAIDSKSRVKIGISNNPKKRIKNLNIGNADKLTLIFTKKAIKSRYKDEVTLHDKCKQFRIRSEWFTPAAIKELS